MTDRKMWKLAWLATVAMPLALSPAHAVAQEAQEAAAADGENDIVVTALRREQRLQDVPAAISALDGDALAAKGAQDYRDYLNTVPGVNFSDNGYRSSRITIRGISDGFGATDPLTGIYIDEAPITEGGQPTLDPALYDVDRVEVLKGPQGTLYGSGSMGGTVRVITKKPRLDIFEGSAQATISDTRDGGWNRRVEGMLNVPIAQDLLGLRVSGGYRKDDGWIDDVIRNEKDANTVEKINARVQLLLKPGPDTSITFGVLYQKENLGIPAFADTQLGRFQTGRVFRQNGESESQLYSLAIQQDFDTMTLVSATNYLKKDSVNSIDATTAIRPLVNRFGGITLGADEGVAARTPGNFRLFTQEIRLSSTGKRPLEWLVGGFYSDARTDIPQTFDFSQAPSTVGHITADEFYVSRTEPRTRQIAGFGELTYNITDRLAATAGVRVFDVDQNTLSTASGLLNGGTTTTQVLRAHKSSFTQKYLLSFQATRDNLIYAQAVEGYRNGGPNYSLSQAACGADLAALGYSSAPTSYGPDRLWNYEIGTKNSLADGRVTLNAAAYYIDWTDIQSSVSLSCGFGFIANAGKATSKGFELEAAVRPTTGLTLNASVSYTDARIKDAAPATQARDDDRLPLSPNWSWNVSGQYERPLGGDLSGFVRGEVNYVGERWNGFSGVGPRALVLDGYTTASARIGVQGDNWSAALFATNLFDTDIIYFQSLGGTPYDVTGQPRTIGLTTRIGF
ncbi:TonB-dependent receptor [Sphingopyxis sp. LARHCG72]